MQKELEKIENEAVEAIEAANSKETLDSLRAKYLGRKSVFNSFFSRFADLPPAQRAEYGRRLNSLKAKITALIAQKEQTFASAVQKTLDLTLPGEKINTGSIHPISLMSQKICSIFEKVGFEIVEGKEIEDEWTNFQALNIPLNHPSRDAFDTFYLELANDKKYRYLLRSHTSPSQIHTLLKLRPPLAVISPGRVYRPDATDASHSFMFHQIEGLAVGKDINFGHLKQVLLLFARGIFGEDVRLRFRPHFFPFTEPSAEVDLQCLICKGKGCSVCSQSGWLEILGCGMVHPQVLRNCHINPRKYRGFAFGMGVERIAMLQYKINDIRLFFENDIRFLEQFYEI